VENVETGEVCAVTPRDLAAEVQGSGVPRREDLQRTIYEAEKVLGDLTSVREELRRLMIEFSQADL